MQVPFGAQQTLEELHKYLTSRFEEYAMQWGGTMHSSPVDVMLETWTWILCFNGVENATHFVLGTQFGMRTENWPEDFFSWFPENGYSADGQLTFRGPRVAMLIHATPKAAKKTEEKVDVHSHGTESHDTLPSISKQPSESIMAVKEDRMSSVGYDLVVCRGPQHCCAMHPIDCLRCLGSMQRSDEAVLR